MPRPNPLLLVTTTVLFAVNYPLGSLAVHAMSPFLVIALRFALTGAILWAVVAFVRRGLPRGRQWWHAVGAGVLVQGAQFLGCYWAMANGVGAGIVALVVAMNPVLVTVLTGVLDRRREPLLGYAAVLLGAVAVALACLPRIVRDPSMGAGLVAVVIALVGVAVGTVWQGRALGGVSPVAFTAIASTASLPVALVLLPLAPIAVDPGPIPWMLLGLVTVVGLFSMVLFSGVVARLGARRASLLFAVIPALAAIFAWALLGEPLDALVVVALVLGAAACILDLRVAARETARNEHVERVRSIPTDGTSVFHSR